MRISKSYPRIEASPKLDSSGAGGEMYPATLDPADEVAEDDGVAG